MRFHQSMTLEKELSKFQKNTHIQKRSEMMVILWDMLMQTCLKHELPMIGLSKRQCMLEIEGTYKVVKYHLDNVGTMYDFRKSGLYKHMKFRDFDEAIFGGHGSYNRVSNPLCDNCPHANVIETSQNESPEYDMEWLKNMLEEYGIEDDSDLIGDEEMLFICYPKCSTCQKAKKWLDEHNIKYTERHIVDANPTYDELKEWYGKSGLPLKKFFNTSGLLYKEMQLKDKLSTMSEEEQLQLLATNGMLVKRPLIVNGDTVLVGFKEAEWSEKLN